VQAGRGLIIDGRSHGDVHAIFSQTIERAKELNILKSIGDQEQGFHNG
jgi:hypothetical protein